MQGGTPVRDSYLPYSRQNVYEEDIQSVIGVLRSDWLTTGPKVEKFEQAFADAVGASFAISFSSGTAALHAAVFAAGIGPGDEVIVPALTFCATSNCVLYQGGTPVFADVLPETLTLDPEKISTLLTPQTRALIPVDYAGHPAELSAIMEIADGSGLVVIEDACHALGAEYRSRKVGSIVHMTVFSFHPVKHITTGEGGMVATNDPTLTRRLRRFRNHGIDKDARQRQLANQWQYDMSELGYNYRLSDISCALGLTQLGKLSDNLGRRHEIAARYNAAFARLPGVEIPTVRDYVCPAWHLYAIRLDPWIVQVSRDEVLNALRAENIGANVHYRPVYLHSYYRKRFGYCGGECPVAETAYESLISLPLFHGMSDQDAEDVIEAVNRVVTAFSAIEEAG